MTDQDLQIIESRSLDGHHPYSHAQDCLDLIEEVRRLRAGDFTEEEFQNLCHKFSSDDACRFAQGCLEHNIKLFGELCRLELKK